MSKKPHRGQPHNVTSSTTPPPERPGASLALSLLVPGVLCLLIALLASGMLVFTHFAHLDLPGCGPDSACADAQDSAFGKIPGLNWPMSHVGFAWFLGLLTAWLSFARSGLSPMFRTLVRIGAAGSLAFLVIMIVKQYLCVYCITTHLANFGFLACVESAWRKPRILENDAGVALAVGCLVSIIMIPMEILQTRESADKARRETDASVKEVIEASGGDSNLFVGRYVKGPKRAALRMVLFSDFQCEVCKRVEDELQTILEKRSDIAVSIKHFPLSSDCNEYLARHGANPHPNACRAAQAAEAAGILKGDKGFFEMHDVLFQKYVGDFTDDQLREDLARLGYQPEEFFRVMNADETVRGIRADIDEGRSLGLHYTPMVFINGVQIKGVRQPGMLTRAINQISAANPPARTWGDAGDAPPDADAKIIADWRATPKIELPPDHFRWSRGEENAADIVADVVVFGDYQEKHTKRIDEIMRNRVEKQPGIRYTFRHCPFDQKCNPNISKTFHPQACLAARASEAAGALGGPDLFWRMHVWLWPNSSRFNMDNFKKVSRAFGLDPEEFAETMISSEVEAALQEDVQATWDLKINSIPTVYINGKRVMRWRLQEDEKMSLLLDELAGAVPAEPESP